MKTEQKKLEGRLLKHAAPELIDTAFKYEVNDSDVLIDGMSKADIAHTIMLLNGGIIPSNEGKILLTALLKLDQFSFEDYDFTPFFGDTYTNRENYLTKEIGSISGWLNVARARRECTTIGFLLAVRNRILELGNALVGLSKSILEKVKENFETIMPDFTYLQYAQPTTLAHYLLTFEYSILRDFERLEQSYKRVNKSPAGCGSVNGSRMILNREMLAELLGFNGLSTHTRDAMWRTDIPLEVYSNIVCICINVNRLVEELQIWSSEGFKFIELSDSHCRTSVIMPQKKNPYGLSYFRGLTGLIIGRLTGQASILKAISGQPDNRIFTYGDLPRSIDMVTDGIKLISAIIHDLKVNKEVLKSHASMGFSCATDLAEILMLKNKSDYKSVHSIIGRAVRLAMEAGLDNFDMELVNQAVREGGLKHELTQDEFDEIVNITEIVNSRRGIGNASKDRVLEMWKECNAITNSFECLITQKIGSNQLAIEKLIKKAESICL
ncbi:argininosuccinate lyase [Legionella israelensis]|uniref:argininosuccinate lyase n=1 Tax=Legionella israelensis TaxID=454 RepID=UPI00163D5ADA|nr:argininosuccinate lyase [Legionella israelensis]